MRGLRPGPTRALRCQVSKHRVLGFVPHFPQLFVWPFFPERPLGGGGSWVSLSPPDPSVDKGGGGIPECRGPGSEQLPARWDLRTCLLVSTSLGSPGSIHALQSLGVSEHVPFSLHASASFPAGTRCGSGVTLLELRLRRQDWPGAGWSLLPFRAGERAPHSETTGLASCQDAPVAV